MERITEIATEINNQFTKDYAMWFEEMINEAFMEPDLKVDSIYHLTTNQMEMKAGSKIYMNRQLLQAPIPKLPIKSGLLRKLGNTVKNWKVRYFVAFNQADNYDIAYYKDASRVKEKGRIQCCGLV